ncbi:gliding motility-associated C-terminal domain-containing protein [Flavobacterium sp. N1719]|uniref:gliding motility-associated C-terminal domain-containing protein n=1 Tax=Flavobacterium sp. N1719 TaxID=2885633 RepID=UPI00222180E5|nr:gliding motility-associated C-terminal domain-containing protein [Flavobacterium sp. N1719]
MPQRLHNYFVVVCFLLFWNKGNSQLTTFMFTVNTISETCSGNGSMEFVVSNTTAGATFTFAIYQLPNTTTPIAVTGQSNFTGLAAGGYLVVATQIFGNLSNTQQVFTTIGNQLNPLAYTLQINRNGCFNGDVTVNVTSGAPVTYELISGPLTIPPQTSNSFINLPPGVYNVRVVDNCGEGLVQSFTIDFENPPNINFLSFTTECELVTCDVISGQLHVETMTDLDFFRYPLTVETLVLDPNNGTTITTTTTVATGDDHDLFIPIQMPFYNNQAYQYSFVITDACGIVHQSVNYILNTKLTATFAQVFDGCSPSLSVNVCNFKPPYTLEFLQAPAGFNPGLFNSTHPGPFTDSSVVYASTTSNNIPLGDYTIRVTDACGRVDIQSLNLHYIVPSFTNTINVVDCQTMADFNLDLGTNAPGGTVIVTVAPPAFTPTLPLDLSAFIVGGYLNASLPAGEYTFTGVNSCGVSFSFSFQISTIIPSVSAFPLNLNGCGNQGIGDVKITIEPSATLQTIQLVSAPPNYPNPLPYDYSSTIQLPDAIIAQIDNVPFGTYTFIITDSCGNSTTKIVTLSTAVNTGPSLHTELTGCGEGYLSIKMTTPNFTYISCEIIAAPSAYAFPLPHNLNAGIATNGAIYLNDIPEGNYTIKTIDQCGIIRVENFQFLGYHYSEQSQIIPQCNSFSLLLQVTDNNPTPHRYWLQKWNSTLGQWTHPFTGVVYTSNTIPNATNSFGLVFGLNPNIMSEGHFRILSVFEYYNFGILSNKKCYQTVKEFDYTDDLFIINAIGVNCLNANSVVKIFAQGIPPLEYSITSFNGTPFVFSNGTNNEFVGLQPGIYNFTVEDSCGNIVNRDYDITQLNPPSITAQNLCEGQAAQLSIDLLSFYTYKWWKTTDPSNILSTSHILNLNPFTNATTPGTYVVELNTTVPNTCTAQQFTYVIQPIVLPYAGNDTVVEFCDAVTSLDLATLLQGNFDAGGNWNQVVPSGNLTGAIWDATGVTHGTYVFTYQVAGVCNTLDEAQLTLILKEPIPDLVGTDFIEVCSGTPVAFTMTTVTNAQYLWTGPNGFSSVVQEPSFSTTSAVDSGIYQLVVTRNGCQKTTSVELVVHALPEFTLVQGCFGGQYKVELLPLNNSFDPTMANYNWTGPASFSSTDNPIFLQQQPAGNYSVTVTDNNGCTANLPFEITSTMCDFPNIITPNDDGNNDAFDLTGFEVKLLEIYNRWGRKVYDKSNYINEWRGQNQHGGTLPDGVYYYLITLRDGHNKNGWVMVNRGN